MLAQAPAHLRRRRNPRAARRVVNATRATRRRAHLRRARRRRHTRLLHRHSPLLGTAPLGAVPRATGLLAAAALAAGPLAAGLLATTALATASPARAAGSLAAAAPRLATALGVTLRLAFVLLAIIASLLLRAVIDASLTPFQLTTSLCRGRPHGLHLCALVSQPLKALDQLRPVLHGEGS